MVLNFFLHPEFHGAFLFIKLFLILVSIIMIAAIMFLLLETTWLERFFTEDFVEAFAKRPFGAKKAFKVWTAISKRSETGKEEEYKLAIMEADNLLDEVLKTFGYKGETLSEKLGQIEPNALSNIDEVLQAHHARNNIVHNPDFKVTLDMAKIAMDIYEKAFRELGVF